MDQINEAIERSVKKLIDTNSCFASNPFSSFFFFIKILLLRIKKKREKNISINI